MNKNWKKSHSVERPKIWPFSLEKDLLEVEIPEKPRKNFVEIQFFLKKMWFKHWGLKPVEKQTIRMHSVFWQTFLKWKLVTVIVGHIFVENSKASNSHVL